MGEYFYNLNIGRKRCSHYDFKKKDFKLDHTKLKKKKKNTSEWQKKKMPNSNWEKIFTTDITEKGLISCNKWQGGGKYKPRLPHGDDHKLCQHPRNH